MQFHSAVSFYRKNRRRYFLLITGFIPIIALLGGIVADILPLKVQQKLNEPAREFLTLFLALNLLLLLLAALFAIIVELAPFLREIFEREYRIKWYLEKLKAEVPKETIIDRRGEKLDTFPWIALKRKVTFLEEFTTNNGMRFTRSYFRETKKEGYEVFLSDAVYEHPYLLVLGEPGIGKTTLVNKIVDQQATIALVEENKTVELPKIKGMVPWVIDLTRGLDITTSEGSEKFERESISYLIFRSGLRFIYTRIHDSKFRKKEFDRLIKEKKLWFLCDAYDQLSDDVLGNEMLNWIIDSGCRLLITSRRIGAPEKLIRLNIVEIKKLSLDEQKKLLACRLQLPSLEDPRINSILQQAAPLGDITTIPFYLVLITDVYKKIDDVPLSRGELLRRCAAERIANQLSSHLGDIVDASDKRITRIINNLGHFAYDLHREDLTYLQVDSFNNRNYVDVKLVNLLKKAEILVVTSDNDKISFTHRRWQEWFSGHYLRLKWKNHNEPNFTDDNISQIVEHWTKFLAYDDTLIFCAELMNKPDEFIKWIADREPVLAARIIYETGKLISKEICSKLWCQLACIEDSKKDEIRPQYPAATRGLCYLALSKTFCEENEVKHSLEALVHHKDGLIREQVILALENLNDAKTIPLLKEVLQDRVYRVRHIAAITLGKIGSLEAVNILKEALMNIDDSSNWRFGHSLEEINCDRIIVALLDALQKKAYNIRKQVVKTLGRIGSSEAVEVLKITLRDEEKGIRKETIETLKKIDREKINEILKEALQDSDNDIRLSVAEFFSKKGDDKAISALKEALDNVDNNIRRRAVEILKLFDNIEIIPVLKKALNDPDHGVRQRAVEALGLLGDTTIIPILKEILRDKNSNVRGNAVEALGLLGDTTIIPILKEALNDPDHGVRWRAIEALGSLDNGDAVLALKDALHSTDNSIRRKTLETLGALSSAEAVVVLKEVIYDEKIDNQREIIETLGKTDSDEVLELLEELLCSENEDFRWMAAIALGKKGYSKVVSVLKEALHKGDEDIRLAVTVALGRIGIPEAVSALNKLSYDSNSSIRRNAIESLGRIGGTEVISVLKEKIHDKEASVRRSVVATLGSLGDVATIPLLKEALNDPDHGVRRRAIEALGSLGDVATIPLLKEALNDPDHGVR
ncbi:MAG: HEAT repeat domain-containing protein, partial [Candidatus Odinarchaeota archaeon]